MITPFQMRMARVALGLSQGAVAKEVGMTTTKIMRLENEVTDGTSGDLKTIKLFFENRGLEFTEGEGVRKHKTYVRYLSGSNGLIDLMEDVCRTAQNGGDVRLYNARPENWLRWVTVDWFKGYTRRMASAAGTFTMHILAEEGNTKLISSGHAVHRWFPKKLFISENESLYVYGDRLGFVTFGPDNVEIQILQSPKFASGVRALFDVAWDYVGIVPPVGEKLEEVDFSEWEGR
ncbi:MAG: helix-turn-helix transcriptional regulator [Alphaproteobacteria bacterium]|jgi:transcriptional regulator with XRE-family HTH domain|nr:helix-turn-helix transcriptional regulator [Alphaproteobacteria bacterium]